MTTNNPKQTVELLDEAFNAADIERVLSFYEDEAVLVVEPGTLATGKSELRAAFEQILASKASVKQEKSLVIEADGIALFISEWTFSRSEPDGRTATRQFIATSVFRKQNDGSWRLLIDNSFGPSVLE